MTITDNLPNKYERYILQNRTELFKFGKLLNQNGVRSYLEIGCKFGGSLWYLGNVLPKGSRIVAVDLPQGDASFKQTEPALTGCCQRLNKNGYDCHLVIGDSTNPETVKKVHALGPYDAVFIDGNHTLPFIKKDWENYGSIAKIVAFHDISFNKPWPAHKKPIEVPAFWNKIKEQFRHQEIRFEPDYNGIGILWR